jgi:hypothetical protein
MPEPIFTEYRRDLIARTSADLLKILFAAALASKLFVEFPARLKLGLLALSVVLGLLAFFGCPRKNPKG